MDGMGREGREREGEGRGYVQHQVGVYQVIERLEENGEKAKARKETG